MVYFNYRKDYVCHLSSYQKVKTDQNQKGKSKNLNCPAKIKIVIKNTTVNTIKYWITIMSEQLLMFIHLLLLVI